MQLNPVIIQEMPAVFPFAIWKYKYQNIKNYNFACCFICMWNFCLRNAFFALNSELFQSLGVLVDIIIVSWISRITFITCFCLNYTFGAENNNAEFV